MDFTKIWYKLRFTLLLCWKLRENSTSFQNGVTETGGINTELFILHFTHMEKGQSSGALGAGGLPSLALTAETPKVSTSM